MAQLLNGKEVAEKILAELKIKAASFPARPTLGIISVGEDPASQVYIKKKIKAAEEIGVKAKHYQLRENTEERELLKLIEELNLDPEMDGFIVQLPLPEQIREERIIESVSPEKDLDGFHPFNQGKMFQGIINSESLLPATPLGIMKLLEHYQIELEGKKAVMVGRSNIVGKPLAALLLNKNATVTIAHSKTKNLAEHTQAADIIIAAVGKPNLITVEMIKQGAIVIDVGMNRVNGKLVGDVDFEKVKEKAAYITPVPGGVGQMTVAMLMYNLISRKDKDLKLND